MLPSSLKPGLTVSTPPGAPSTAFDCSNNVLPAPHPVSIAMKQVLSYMTPNPTPILFCDRHPKTTLLLHHQLLLTLCHLAVSLPQALLSLAWSHLRFVPFPFAHYLSLRLPILLPKDHTPYGLSSLQVAWSLEPVLFLGTGMGRPRHSFPLRFGEMESYWNGVGSPCPWVIRTRS